MYRFQVKARRRSPNQAPPSLHCAYILREEAYAPASAHVTAMLRESEKAQCREDLIDKDWANLPWWANDSPSAFFAAAEQYEGANRRLATTWEIALPREMTTSQRGGLVREFLHMQFDTHYIYAWAIHESQATDGGTNPHVHVLFSSRRLDGIPREP